MFTHPKSPTPGVLHKILEIKIMVQDTQENWIQTYLAQFCFPGALYAVLCCPMISDIVPLHKAESIAHVTKSCEKIVKRIFYLFGAWQFLKKNTVVFFMT